MSCQHQEVTGFIGDDVLLPCVHGDVSSLPEKVSVFWRDKDDKIVLNIVDNVEYRQSQDQRFKDRVFSFSDEYKKGNFSVIMKKLQQEDDGSYQCDILDVDKKDITVRVSGQTRLHSLFIRF